MGWIRFKQQQPEPRPPEPAPLLAGRYRLGAPLGTGGSATVYEAVDVHTHAPVAAKIAPLPYSLPLDQRADWLARLQREVSVTRRLAHPDILAVLDAGIDASSVWMVTERVHGHDLARYGHRSRLLPEPVVLRIGARIGAALAFAHGRGIVHRDLKPANVLVDLPNDVVKLADFGVARVHDTQLTRTGLVPGTPVYMSPEQLAGTPATADSDTYALGVMLFELLCGQRPHRAGTLGELLQAMRQQAAPSLAALRPDLPHAVVALIDPLLANDPAGRPADLGSWSAEVAVMAAIVRKAQASRSAGAV